MTLHAFGRAPGRVFMEDELGLYRTSIMDAVFTCCDVDLLDLVLKLLIAG